MAHHLEPDPYDLKPDLGAIDTAGLVWRTAAASNGAGGWCVQLALVDDGVVVRDSNGAPGAVLGFSAREWSAFVDGVKTGEFDDSVVV